MAAEILPHFKQDVTEFIMIPAGDGKFELFVDDKQIYSKLETGEFPDSDDIITAIEAAQDS